MANKTEEQIDEKMTSRQNSKFKKLTAVKQPI